jgi:hypothetical protein
MHPRLLWELKQIFYKNKIPDNMAVELMPDSCIFLLTGTAMPYEKKFKLVDGEHAASVIVVDPSNYPRDNIEVVGIMTNEIHKKVKTISSHYYDMSKLKPEFEKAIKYFCNKRGINMKKLRYVEYCASFLARENGRFNINHFQGNYAGRIGGMSIVQTLHNTILCPGTEEAHGHGDNRDELIKTIKETHTFAEKFTCEKQRYKIRPRNRKNKKCENLINNINLCRSLGFCININGGIVDDILKYVIIDYWDIYDIARMTNVFNLKFHAGKKVYDEDKENNKCYYCKKTPQQKYMTIVYSKKAHNKLQLDNLKIGRGWLCDKCSQSDDYLNDCIREEGTSYTVMGVIPTEYTNKKDFNVGFNKLAKLSITKKWFKKDYDKDRCWLVMELIIHFLNQTLAAAINEDKSSSAIYFYKYNYYVNKIMKEYINDVIIVKNELGIIVDCFLKSGQTINLDKLIICAFSLGKYDLKQICEVFVKSKLKKDKMNDRLEKKYVDKIIKNKISKNRRKVGKQLEKVFNKKIQEHEYDGYITQMENVKAKGILHKLNNTPIYDQDNNLFNKRKQHIMRKLIFDESYEKELRKDYEKYCNAGLGFFMIRVNLLNMANRNRHPTYKEILKLHDDVENIFHEQITLDNFVKHYGINPELFDFEKNGYFKDDISKFKDKNHFIKAQRRNKKNERYKKNKETKELLKNLEKSGWYTIKQLCDMVEYIGKNMDDMRTVFGDANTNELWYEKGNVVLITSHVDVLINKFEEKIFNGENRVFVKKHVLKAFQRLQKLNKN